MRESPRQPKHLDTEIQAYLAIMSHRIERWDILLDTTLPFDVRKEKLIADINAEIRMLNEEGLEEDDDAVAEEIDELLDDAHAVSELANDPVAIAAMHAEQSKYRRSLRDEFLKGL